MRISLVACLVFVAACRDSLDPTGVADRTVPLPAADSTAAPHPMPSAGRSAALDSLLSATVFETPSRGMSLGDPPNWIAWREVLRSATAAADFRYLYDNATTPEGRMYGAAGILAGDPAALAGLSTDPRWGDVEILYISGCTGTPMPATMLLPMLATARMREYFRTGRDPLDPSGTVRTRSGPHPPEHARHQQRVGERVDRRLDRRGP